MYIVQAVTERTLVPCLLLHVHLTNNLNCLVVRCLLLSEDNINIYIDLAFHKRLEFIPTENKVISFSGLN